MKSILVALDDSPRAAGVLDLARDLAVKTGGRLHLFRAVTLPSGLPPQALALPPEDVEAMLRRHAERDLKVIAHELPPAVRGDTLIGLGAPWRAICAAAAEHKVDLVVIGSHGYHGLDHVLGTTAAKVVNHADRPVLVVKPMDHLPPE